MSKFKLKDETVLPVMVTGESNLNKKYKHLYHRAFQHSADTDVFMLSDTLIFDETKHRPEHRPPREIYEPIKGFKNHWRLLYNTGGVIL